MSEDWITLKTYNTMMEASLAQSILEQHDIFSLLEDSQMAVMHSPGVGGIKLRIPSGETERAFALLNENQGE